MNRIIGTVFRDVFGLARVCGWTVALRWLAMIALNWRSCLRRRDLQPADRAMGVGPFAVRLGKARAKLYGVQVIGCIREIWVRDVYLGGGTLSIPAGGTVLDLGAYIGDFTLLALGHGPDVRCIAVEPNPHSIGELRKNLESNGWLKRGEICQAFLGGPTEELTRLKEQIGPKTTPHISEEQLVRQYALEHIDLLKCDIEGSEFELLRPGSLLLAMCDQLAIELHGWGGDMPQFLRMLEAQGLEVLSRREGGDGLIVQARRRP